MLQCKEMFRIFVMRVIDTVLYWQVHCVDLNECQLVDFNNADTVPVRQIEV